MGFPKVRAHFFEGVPIVRIVAGWGLHVGVLHLFMETARYSLEILQNPLHRMYPYAFPRGGNNPECVVAFKGTDSLQEAQRSS